MARKAPFTCPIRMRLWLRAPAVRARVRRRNRALASQHPPFRHPARRHGSSSRKARHLRPRRHPLRRAPSHPTGRKTRTRAIPRLHHPRSRKDNHAGTQATKWGLYRRRVTHRMTSLGVGGRHRVGLERYARSKPLSGFTLWLSGNTVLSSARDGIRRCSCKTPLRTDRRSNVGMRSRP